MKRKSQNPHALAFDLGGTKVWGGVVDARGKILKEARRPTELSRGPTGLLTQLSEMCGELRMGMPKPLGIGIASAGPLDPARGTLLDPTNFFTGGKSWGEVKLARELQKRVRLPVALENDAAAAILAEHWKGAARGAKNAMVLTLGTGLGVGVIANGALVRSGRGLHPEGGHITLSAGDSSAPCGCGLLGCAEAYLSGRNFAARFGARNKRPGITGHEVSNLARSGDRAALDAFQEYAERLAQAIHTYVVLYAPERVVFAGSFAESFDLFRPQTVRRLETLLERRRVGHDLMPELMRSTLENRAGLLGGARVAFEAF
jgi:glucokinase